MVPLRPPAIWQSSAHPGFAAVLTFASGPTRPHLKDMAKDRKTFARLRPDHDPSLLSGPDSAWVRPIFSSATPGLAPSPFAEPCRSQNFDFANAAKEAESWRTRNRKRGSSPCPKPSHFLAFWPSDHCRPAPAAVSAPIAPPWARLAARHLGLRPTTTWHKARSPGASLARLQPIGALATDRMIHQRPAGAAPSSKAIRAMPRVAFCFAPAPARGPGLGKAHPCSPRS